jgi:hypothetical protein
MYQKVKIENPSIKIDSLNHCFSGKSQTILADLFFDFSVIPNELSL